MKHGIYYAYWEKEWRADYRRYIEKAARLGFDILEIACTPLVEYSNQQLAEIRLIADDHGVTLTAGHGPSSRHNLASPDPAIRAEGHAFYVDLLQRLYKLNARILCGGIYSYWPIDYTQPLDKPRDWAISVESIRKLAPVAADLGIVLGLEVMNRFDNYILNTAAEGVSFLRQVGHDSVKLHMDTFHMNIEEDSIGGAIRQAGKELVHIHVCEGNRKLPGEGRFPWREFVDALHDIEFTGNLVMEPFVKMGGTVGNETKIWRDLSEGADENGLDEAARQSLEFLRYMTR